MKSFIIIMIGFLLSITGCNDNIGFSKKSSSSSQGEDGGLSGDRDSGEGSSFTPGDSRVREQRTLLNVRHPKTKVDILFVIDNSSSMAVEQGRIASRFDNFIDQIGDLDWHIGITTTDSTPNSRERYWSDGRLVPFSPGLYYLNSSMDIRTARAFFSRHIQRKEDGSDVERGIYTTYRTLERGALGNTEVDRQIAQFIRYDADFAVVLVSDEDEAPANGNCQKNCSYRKRSQPDNLIKYVNSLFGVHKVFQFHSIITHTKACLDGQGYSYGRKYKELSMKTGGVIGNICSDDYSNILSMIGRKVLNLNKSYKLECKPLDFDKNGIMDIRVTSDSFSRIPTYSVTEEIITFDESLVEGDYQLTYHCLK